MSDFRCLIGDCNHNLCGKCCNGGECDYDFEDQSKSADVHYDENGLIDDIEQEERQ